MDCTQLRPNLIELRFGPRMWVAYSYQAPVLVRLRLPLPEEPWTWSRAPAPRVVYDYVLLGEVRSRTIRHVAEVLSNWRVNRSDVLDVAQSLILSLVSAIELKFDQLQIDWSQAQALPPDLQVRLTYYMEHVHNRIDR
jgi:hypothetical protein